LLAIVADGDPCRLAAALNMTFHQIHAILLAKRDKDGRVEIAPKTQGISQQEAYFIAYFRRGYPRWRIEEMWQAKVKQEAEAEAKRAEESTATPTSAHPKFSATELKEILTRFLADQ
jgi:hypothetical protein